MQIKRSIKQKVGPAQIDADQKTGEIVARGNVALPYETYRVLSGHFIVKANQSEMLLIVLVDELRLKGLICQPMFILPGESVQVAMCLVNPTSAQQMIAKDEVLAIIQSIAVPKQDTKKKEVDASADDSETSETSDSEE